MHASLRKDWMFAKTSSSAELTAWIGWLVVFGFRDLGLGFRA